LEEATQNVVKLRSSSVHPKEYWKTGTEKVKKEKKSDIMGERWQEKQQ